MDKSKVCAVLLALVLWSPTASRAQTDTDLAFLNGQSNLPPNVMILFDTSLSMGQITWDRDFDPNKFYDRPSTVAPVGAGVGETSGECGIPAVKIEPSTNLPVHYDPYIITGLPTNQGYVDLSGTATYAVPVNCASPKFTSAMCTEWKNMFGSTSCTASGSSFSFKFPNVDSAGHTYWNLNYMHYLLHTLHTTGKLPPKFVKETRIMTGRNALLDLMEGVDDPNDPDDVAGVNPDSASGNCSSATPKYNETVRFGLARYRVDNSGTYGHGYGSYVTVPIASCNKASIKSSLIALGATDKGTPLRTGLIDVGRYFTGSFNKLGATATDPNGYTAYNLGTAAGTGTSLATLTTGSAPASPISTTTPCRKNFILYVTDGNGNQECPDDTGRGDTSIGTCPSGSLGAAIPVPGTSHKFFQVFLNNGAGSWSWEPGRETVGGFPGTTHLDKVTYFLGHAQRSNTPIDPNASLTPNLISGGNKMLTKIPVYIVGFAKHDAALENAAVAGDGAYYTAQDRKQLATALVASVNDILLRNKTFAATSVPSSRLSAGQTFFRTAFDTAASGAMFTGHLQAYVIGTRAANAKPIDTAPVKICTGLQLPASMDPNNPDTPRSFVVGDSGTGCALATDPNGTFMDTVEPYWDAQDQYAASALSDPNKRTLYVNRGGAANGQNLFFAPASGPAFDANDPNVIGLVAADVGKYPNDPNQIASYDTLPELRVALINYARGEDSFDEDRDGNKTERRTAVLGDIFHSNPIVIGSPPVFAAFEDGFGPATDPASFYGQTQKRKRVVYAGANDGFLHAFDAGNFTDPNAAVDGDEYYTYGTGKELFGYMPSFLLKHVHELARSPKPFFVDGSAAAVDAWIPKPVPGGAIPGYKKLPSEWATALVTGMRNGEEGYLALDVSWAAATQAAGKPYPRLLWEYTDPNRLGRTWSRPVLTRVKVDRASGGDFCGENDGDSNCIETWVAIFGGGYRDAGDPASASFTGTGTASAGLYVVELATGSLLAYQATGAGCSVPSDPAVVDWNGDGFADLVYAGDLCGNLFKWNISPKGVKSAGLVTNWPFGKFFTTPIAANGHKRSIFTPPSISRMKGKLTLAFGTGERTNLTYNNAAPGTNTDENHFYVIFDPQPTGTVADPNTAIPATPYTVASLAVLNGQTTVSNANGFYLKGDATEKFISSPLAFGGTLLMTSYVSNVASAQLCKPQGQGRLYEFSLATGEPQADSDPTPDAARWLNLGGGVPTSPSVSVSGDQAQVVVQTAEPKIIIDNRPFSEEPVELLYWRQM